jgi:hypothetical protein
MGEILLAQPSWLFLTDAMFAGTTCWPRILYTERII